MQHLRRILVALLITTFLLLGNKANILQEREFNNEIEEKTFKK